MTRGEIIEWGCYLTEKGYDQSYGPNALRDELFEKWDIVVTLADATRIVRCLPEWEDPYAEEEAEDEEE